MSSLRLKNPILQRSTCNPFYLKSIKLKTMFSRKNSSLTCVFSLKSTASNYFSFDLNPFFFIVILIITSPWKELKVNHHWNKKLSRGLNYLISESFKYEVTQQAYSASLLSVSPLVALPARHGISRCHWTSFSFGAAPHLFLHTCALECCEFRLKKHVCLHGASDRPSGQQKKDTSNKSCTDTGKS